MGLADHFKSADKYLVSLPMWNFSIPYKLKHYIDLLVHRRLTFSFTPEEGYKGLVTGRPLVAVCARGGDGPGSGAEAWDQQGKYLETYLRIHRLYRDPEDSRRADGGEAHTPSRQAVAAASHQAAVMAANF